MSVGRMMALGFGALLAACTASAQVPGLLNYQGRLTYSGSNANGVAQFRFALMSPDGSRLLWSNSPDANNDGQPDSSVAVNVNAGLFTVNLGDTNLPGMAALPLWVFTNTAMNLRIWADDGTHGLQRLTPDQVLGSSGYSMMAAAVADGSITPAKLATNTASAVTASLTAQVAALSTQLNALATQYSNSLSSGLTMASSDPQDPTLSSQGFRVFASFPAPAWVTSAAVDAPSPRSGVPGVWTGTELMVWGGTLVDGTDAASGGRYNPAADQWLGISPVNAPAARSQHTAVWSGRELIVWGGFGSQAFLNTGSRYNPSNQLWTVVSTTNAPDNRAGHVAAWTGSQMAIWGGRNSSGLLGNGGLYNPNTDQWTTLPATGAPAPRWGAAAVWTGSALIIWGGVNETGPVNVGGQLLFDGNGLPTSWRSLGQTASPAGRSGHTAVWTGRKMLVWGGQVGGVPFGDGAAYDPTNDTWTAISPADAPAPRSGHAAVWTGQEMIIFGGETAAGTAADGAAYDPATDRWRPLSLNGAQPRSNAAAVWSGSELVVFGGRANGQPLAMLQRLNSQPNWYLYRKP